MYLLAVYSERVKMQACGECVHGRACHARSSDTAIIKANHLCAHQLLAMVLTSGQVQEQERAQSAYQSLLSPKTVWTSPAPWRCTSGGDCASSVAMLVKPELGLKMLLA